MSDILIKTINISVAILILTMIFNICKFVFGTSWKGLTFIYDCITVIKETVGEMSGNLSAEHCNKVRKIRFKDTDIDESEDSYSAGNNVYKNTERPINQSYKINKSYKINNKTIDFNEYKNNRFN